MGPYLHHRDVDFCLAIHPLQCVSIRGTIIHAAGFEGSELVCTAASYLSLVFYSLCKFFVYAYITDRVQVLWAPDANNGRPRTYIYFTGIISAVVYCVIVTLMISSPISEIRRGECEIGLKPLGSIPLLVFHVYVNIFVTFMFLFPLVNWTLITDNLKQLAYRLALAAFIAFSTSTVNTLVLILSDGRELAWVNLTACVADILINIVAMFWASSYEKPKPPLPDQTPKRTSRWEGRRSPSVASLTSNRTRASTIRDSTFREYSIRDRDRDSESLALSAHSAAAAAQRSSRRMSQPRPDSLHRLSLQPRPLADAELGIGIGAMGGIGVNGGSGAGTGMGVAVPQRAGRRLSRPIQGPAPPGMTRNYSPPPGGMIGGNGGTVSHGNLNSKPKSRAAGQRHSRSVSQPVNVNGSASGNGHAQVLGQGQGPVLPTTKEKKHSSLAMSFVSAGG
ncbi:hypothetical protein CC1G_14369 [Coprinopsis cinerea okayama7|uniref:Uncharacterized protein n=1 Tax=Coprinopsis cinerea (strain Okayama-7 / 130 / ATCC MYA-4618 / FGSC 9003) TaxID=240176 RepID=D6RM80_COPC7|nr:hypothetical protein CC1G_14369 [Coprinopsis cinerea okayama7\|eukprot:XP_002911372.1 hypothetical protein CC1G_14369 [Coprinopsis cinerea okayama7\